MPANAGPYASRSSPIRGPKGRPGREAGVLWELLDQPAGVTDPAWRTFPLRMPGDWLISLLLARQTLDERDAYVLVDLILIDEPIDP